MTSFHTRPEEYESVRFSEKVRCYLCHDSALRVLEAGCGRKWDLDLSGFVCCITGVDTDERALADRLVNVKDLDEAILGDLLKVSLCPASYDLVYCAFVLEHIKGASELMDRLFLWTRPGGLVVLRIPDGHSVFGFLTKHTPQWLHVVVARYLLRHLNPKQGFGPYPTVYEGIVSSRGVHDYCAANNHEILVENYSDVRSQVRGLQPFVQASVRLVSGLSLGRLSPHQDLHFVIRKRSQ
jgi:hypothetical protein